MPIRTPEEARAWRAKIDGTLIPKIADSPAEVNESVALIAAWQPGTVDNPKTWAYNDVRKEGDTPYRCCQGHVHRGEVNWNPSAATALWTEYHGTSVETARPWRQPTGAHDMYLADEYMVWTDGHVYRAKQNTTYSPSEYAQAWEQN